MGDLFTNNLEKLRSGTLSEKERKEILALFHQSDLEYDLKKELFHQLNTSSENESTLNTSVGFARLWKRIEAKKQKAKGKSFRFHYAYWAAAILIFGVLLGNLFSFQPRLDQQKKWFTAIAPTGSISEVILPDGTLIYLNAGSELKYSSLAQNDTREVFLSGEAWFDVEKSKEYPFIVHTSNYDVRVMGTEFNVKAYAGDDDVITTLEEGSVQIQSTNEFKIGKSVVLKPGEQFVYNKLEHAGHVNLVKPEVFSSWKDNKLIFINMSLGELVALLERKYGVTINVPDTTILNYHYDGTIKNETIIEVLNILQRTLPIDYIIKDQEVTILKK